MVLPLDDEIRKKIEANRLEALKRLEERRKRLLENENGTIDNTQTKMTQQTKMTKHMTISSITPNVTVTSESSIISNLVPTTTVPTNITILGLKRPAEEQLQRSLPDTFLRPLPPLPNNLQSPPLKTLSLSSGCGVRALVQLASPKTFTITATSAVQTICRQIIAEVLFDRTTNVYTVPLNRYNYILENLTVGDRPQGHLLIPKTILAAFEPGQISQRSAALSLDYRIESVIGKDLYNSLFPYQREGVRMAVAKRGKLIIADEMGLGKSIQAIATALYFRREWPLLILAPASMVASWHQQILRWIPEETLPPANVQVIYDGKVQNLTGTVTILSYDLAVKLSELIQSRNFRVVIADECHALRNIETKRSKTLVPIISSAERALLLSGTPALSRPIELFPQIQIINPKLFPKRHDYALRYCEAHKNYFGGWDMRGSANLTELQIVLENCVMIRRMKDQVLTELPPKIRRQVFLKLPTATKNFKMFQLQTAEYLSSVDLSAPLESIQKKAEFMALWKRTADVKLEAMIEYVEDLLDANHKMLIFAHHTSIIDGFASHFLSKKITYIRIDGKTPPNQRQEICTAFQNDEQVRLALLSITAASTGITLTKATTVIFAELFFNPGVLMQAEDRAHRIGQMDCVNVHYLLAKGTTDDHIWPLILKKLNTLESVGLGKNNFKDISAREHDQTQLTIDKFFSFSTKEPPDHKIEGYSGSDVEADDSRNEIFDLTDE